MNEVTLKLGDDISKVGYALIKLDTEQTVTFDYGEVDEIETILYYVEIVLNGNQVAYEIHDQPNHGTFTINVLP